MTHALTLLQHLVIAVHDSGQLPEDKFGTTFDQDCTKALLRSQMSSREGMCNERFAQKPCFSLASPIPAETLTPDTLSCKEYTDDDSLLLLACHATIILSNLSVYGAVTLQRGTSVSFRNPSDKSRQNILMHIDVNSMKDL